MSQSTLAINASTSESTFSFGTHNVRVVMRDGEPWFVAADVAEALGYRNAPDAARNLGEHQKASTQIVRSTSGGNPNLTIINESGLYRLVLRSRKPEAEKFSDWVTGEVLPSIRKTGSYSQPAYDPNQIALAHRAALVATAEVYQSVFDAVMQGQDWQLNRYMLRFDATAEDGAVARVKPVDRNAYVMPIERFHSAIDDSMMVDAQTLTQLASTCTTRLGRMAARNAVAGTQGSLQLR
ncbi:BRO-N domain-containing protein [Comamonas avium]|uniref:Bro-N domain-containing protein n=1 Tax=Comamonas avium TaxID=2762231 RepID=A0ABR8SFP8_9BURK|nr:Bro-N domain-containing protein [Comamonas avium]MBD7962164.1 Bro-N domain-containing protein [Comamonas avium]